jgi:hypothetical protein
LEWQRFYCVGDVCGKSPRLSVRRFLIFAVDPDLRPIPYQPTIPRF